MVAMFCEEESKRRAPRIKRRFNAGVEINGKVITGIFTDFSEYGCFMQVRRLLRPKTPVFVRLSVTPTVNILLRGRVVSCREDSPFAPGSKPAGIGIEFKSSPQEYIQFISEMRK